MTNTIKRDMNKLKRLAQRSPFVTLAVCTVAFMLFIAFQSRIPFKNNDAKDVAKNEIAGIKATSDLGKQVELYTELIKRVGPTQAQDDLFKSGLPFTGQTHLLNHAVGDYLYKTYGPAGLLKCKDYFLSSCYHGFVLDAIADGGMPEVAKTFAECEKSGPSVYTQCAHAIGHGFLANGGYKNLPEALKTCDTAAATMPSFPAFNCYDGVFMENIWAIHDGSPSPDRWVRQDDPLYPCDDKRIDAKYIMACWSNQPSLAYQLFQGDIKKVATEVCAKEKNTDYQEMCFDGLARQIHPITEGSVTKTFELCNLMPDKKWDNYCVDVIVGASYSVGDRNVPFEICGKIEESGKSDCYGRIFNNMRSYGKQSEVLGTLCSKVSDPDWRIKCVDMFKK